MPEDGGSSQSYDTVSKVLAILDTVSGLTWFAIAIAGAFILELPSLFAGVDQTPIRTGGNGAAVAGATIG